MANYDEITALDSEALELLQPDEQENDDDYLDDEDLEESSYIDSSSEEEEDEEDSEYYEESEDEVDEPEDDDESFEAIEVDGETYTIDEIMEWKKGNMRQSDYTRKTQEIARQREELNDALQLRTFLQNNPQLLNNLKNGIPVNSPELNKIVGSRESDTNRDLSRRLKSLEINEQLSYLHNKYGDFDEIALFNKATELRTEDLESVYKMISYDSNNSVDVDAIYEKAKNDILAELNENRAKVKTTVSTRQDGKQKHKASLSSEEARVAAGLGISASEYSKWKE